MSDPREVLPDIADDEYEPLKALQASLTESLREVSPEQREQAPWAEAVRLAAVLDAAIERYESPRDPSDPRGPR